VQILKNSNNIKKKPYKKPQLKKLGRLKELTQGGQFSSYTDSNHPLDHSFVISQDPVNFTFRKTIECVFFHSTFYNIKEISRLLNIKANNFSATELLLYAYAKWGILLLHKLKGAFSFVIYDKEANLYFVARSPLCLNLFYYTKIGQEYHFSLNIDDLLNSLSVPKKPNLQDKYTVDDTDTMYEDIYHLPPGHFMTIEDGQDRIERYWHPATQGM